MQELNRFLHYYSRFKNHGHSHKLEEPLMKKAPSKMKKLACHTAQTSEGQYNDRSHYGNYQTMSCYQVTCHSILPNLCGVLFSQIRDVLFQILSAVFQIQNAIFQMKKALSQIRSTLFQIRSALKNATFQIKSSVFQVRSALSKYRMLLSK